MNNEFRNSSSQASTRGIVLIVALLLLVMLTILGVASMSSVIMQERMSSNVNLQTLAFEAASAGVPAALRFDDPDTWPEDECERDGDGGWLGNWEDFVELTNIGNADQDTGLPDGTRIGYVQRVGCFEPPASEIPPEWEDFETVPMQLLVLTRGQVWRGGDLLAQREVEVRIGRRGVGDCLFTVGPLAPGAITVPKSGVFRVEGEEGSCPIQFANSADAAAFREALGGADSDLILNWQPRPPGIISGNLEMPWSDGLTLARAMNAIKIGMRADQLWQFYGGEAYEEPYDDYPPSSITNPFSFCSGTLHNEPTMKAPPSGDLTYVAGDLSLSGKNLVEGLVIVEGEFYTKGGVQYLADLIVLGGDLDGSGMGGEDSQGLIKLQNLSPRYWDAPTPTNDRRRQVAYCTWGDDPPSGDVDDACPESQVVDLIPSTNFRIGGGGNATITAEECDTIRSRWNRLNRCLETMREMMAPNPGPPVPDGMTWFEFHRAYNPVLSGISVGAVPPGLLPINLDIPDFGDEPELVTFELPRCGEFSATVPTITSWREYIDRERWN